MIGTLTEAARASRTAGIANRRWTASVAALALVAGAVLAGCSAADQAVGTASNSMAEGEMSAPAVAPMPPSGGDRKMADAGQALGFPGDGTPSIVGQPGMVIRNGSVDLEVESVAGAFETIRQIAVAANGLVAESSFTGSGEKQNAHLTLRVPEERLGDILARLSELAVKVRTITTGSQDVTEEYADTEATIRNLRAVEAQYIELLGRTGTIADVLQVQDRLNQVRLQIDRTQARRESLASRADTSTIFVSLYPSPTPTAETAAAGFGARLAQAWSGSLNALTALLVVIVYVWWIVPIVIGVVLLALRVMRRERAARSD